jgi:hypothetical protein
MGAAQVSGRFELKAIRKGSPLVDRAVRTLAVAALIFLGIYAPLLHGLLAPPPLTSFTGDVYDDGPPAVLVELVGQSGFYLSLIAGVIVLVLCLQRNQRRWVVILVAILGLAAYGPPLAIHELPSVLDVHDFLTFAVVVQTLPVALIPLAALIYVLRNHATPPDPELEVTQLGSSRT